MSLFHLPGKTAVKSVRNRKSYNPERQKPVIRCSICNGEQVAGFKDLASGRFEEVMLIRSCTDLETFKRDYGITETMEKEY